MKDASAWRRVAPIIMSIAFCVHAFKRFDGVPYGLAKLCSLGALKYSLICELIPRRTCNGALELIRKIIL